jgi:exosome complex component RRP4
MLSIRDEGLGRITRGRIVEITPSKIPRLIGKKGSMISMLKRETECNITVAQNGIALINCKNPKDEELAINAVRKIEAEAHLRGLTDRVSEMIRKEKGSLAQTPKGENNVSGKIS